MYKRHTISEARWPDTPEFVSVAESFENGCSARLLGFVWEAYDALRATVLMKINVSDADEDLERSITALLEPEIHRVMAGKLPFYVQHGPYEQATRLRPPAQPPTYDIAFILHENPRIMWPLEAKLLRSDGQVADYVADVRDQFLTCRYAPFSAEGGMLGYLMSGDPAKAFDEIAKKLPCVLRGTTRYPDRPHRVSDHTRKVPRGKNYPSRFRCHHLILCLKAMPAGRANN
jgi:hypothetical protein